MSLLTPRPAVAGKTFHWEIKDGNEHGVCEISDFGPGFQFQRVFSDTNDVGLTVKTETGDVVFVVADRKYVNEDLGYWLLKSVTPGTKMRLTIFND